MTTDLAAAATDLASRLEQAWNDGDGNDRFDGETGHDTLVFTGSAANEIVALVSAAPRVTLTRDVGAVTMDNTYQPLARPIFIYVSAKSAEKETIKKFVEFYLEHAAALVEEVGYIPLQPESYEAAKHRFAEGIKGSVFASGPKVGVSMADLLKMEK